MRQIKIASEHRHIQIRICLRPRSLITRPGRHRRHPTLHQYRPIFLHRATRVRHLYSSNSGSLKRQRRAGNGVCARTSTTFCTRVRVLPEISYTQLPCVHCTSNSSRRWHSPPAWRRDRPSVRRIRVDHRASPGVPPHPIHRYP